MRPSGSKRGFTLAELAITIAIMAIVTAMIVGNTQRMRRRYHATLCQSNQRQIGLALHLYYNRHQSFPRITDSTLREPLAKLLPEPQVFKCPRDDDSGSVDSYAPYYVCRTTPEMGDLFLLGCPRHRSSVATFTNARATVSSLGTVTANGAKVDQAASEEGRTLANGALRFADGSVLSIAASEEEYGVTVVQSFRLADGSLYTVVKVRGDGEIDVSVTPGSKFEVVTPSAIIGARGTAFTVRTFFQGSCTDVGVDEGAVAVDDLGTQETALLAEGDAASVELPPAQAPAAEKVTSPLPGDSVQTDTRDLIRDRWRKKWEERRAARVERKRRWGHRRGMRLLFDRDEASDVD
jgi:prepilin-type N-terminal cleavage/methylation domain-containing protein